MKARTSILLALVGLALMSQSVQATESLGRLVVFTSQVCGFCRDFQREIGAIYPRTDLARQFPMEIVDKDHPPDSMRQWVKQIHFTPTLIVLDRQGKEQTSILGYRGEESFWASMEEMSRRMASKTASSAQ